jgi:AraC-like DNA-binding protein
LRFTGFYALLLIVPATLGTLYYRSTLSSYVRLVDRVATERVDRVHEVLGLIRDEIERIANHIEIDPALREVLESEGVRTNAGVISALDFKRKTSLIPYSLTNRFIGSYYILSARSASVYGPNTAFTLDTFLRYVVSFPNVPPRAWRDVFLTRYWERRYLPAREIEIDGTPATVVPYFDSHGLGPGSEALVLVLLDANKLQDLLMDVFVEPRGYAAIVDTDGEVIVDLRIGIHASSLPEVPTMIDQAGALGSDDSLPFHVVASRRPSWTVVAAYPETSVAVEARRAGATTLSLIIGLVVAGVGIASLVLYQSYRPISSALAELYKEPLPDLVGRREEARSIAAQLGAGLRGLRDLAGQYREQARDHLLWELLIGVHAPEADVCTEVGEMGIELPEPPYAVVVFRITPWGPREHGGPTSFVLARARIREQLMETFGRIVTPVIVGPTDIAAIIPASPGARKQLHWIVEWARRSLREVIQAGLGRSVTHPSLLSVSFRDADELARVATIGQRPDLQCYSSDCGPDATSSVIGPGRDEEDQVMRAVRQGDSARLLATIGELDRRYADVHSPVSQTEVYVQRLHQIAARAAEEHGPFGYQVDRSRITHLVSYRGAKSTLLETCERVSAHHTERQDVLLRRVRDTVQRDLCDPELSLSSVARKLGVSEFYLSRITPKALGDNFRSFVEQARMRMAAQEIRTNPGEAMKSIMSRCGYRHFNTFNRAFKRVYGVTPGSYRRQAFQRTR